MIYTANTIYFTHKITDLRSISFTGGVCLSLPNFNKLEKNFKIKVDSPSVPFNSSGKVIRNNSKLEEKSIFQFSLFPIFSEYQKYFALARDCFYSKKETLFALCCIEKAFDQFYSSSSESSDALDDLQFLSPLYYHLLEEIVIAYSIVNNNLDVTREIKIFKLNYYLSIESKPINYADAPQLRLDVNNNVESLTNYYSTLPLEEENIQWGPFCFSVPKGWVQQFDTDYLEDFFDEDNFLIYLRSINLFTHPQTNELSFASGGDIFHFSISSLPSEIENFAQYYQISFSIPSVKGPIRINLRTLFFVDYFFSITTVSAQSHHVCFRSLLSRIISTIKVSSENHLEDDQL